MAGKTDVAVVTGAGSGVGRAVAIELAKRGFQLALLGRRIDPLNETISLANATGKALAISCDISHEGDVASMAKRVRDELGAPSVLVNSAGTNIARRALADLSIEDYRHVIDVNLTGAFLVTHAFLPDMRSAGRGTIVHVISDAGLKTNRISGAAYIASKFGLVGLTGTINDEERRNGIRACAVCPGEINTPLLDRRPVPPPPEARQKMLQAEDVAACVMLAIDLPDRATVEQILVRPRVL
jgi:NAD(P)-dependent dehydrogenase (short-subunit alcohol dehydrogenase family)